MFIQQVKHRRNSETRGPTQAGLTPEWGLCTGCAWHLASPQVGLSDLVFSHYPSSVGQQLSLPGLAFCLCALGLPPDPWVLPSLCLRCSHPALQSKCGRRPGYQCSEGPRRHIKDRRSPGLCLTPPGLSQGGISFMPAFFPGLSGFLETNALKHPGRILESRTRFWARRGGPRKNQPNYPDPPHTSPPEWGKWRPSLCSTTHAPQSSQRGLPDGAENLAFIPGPHP